MIKMKKVLAFGTFDGLHPGHIYFLKEAKKYGDFLVVVVARDKTVKEVKGRLPKCNEDGRLRAVKGLGIADRVLLGSKGDKFGVIKRVKPGVICLGYDQKYFIRGLDKRLKRMGIKCKVIRLEAYKPHRFKSSLIK
jgi:FAD synthetase